MPQSISAGVTEKYFSQREIPDETFVFRTAERMSTKAAPTHPPNIKAKAKTKTDFG
jgi:hypothetical protein